MIKKWMKTWKLLKAVNDKEWLKALEASQELSNSCISCHISYKDKVKYIME